MPLLALLLLAAADDLTPPSPAHLLRTAEGRGVQVYRCDANAWTLIGPEAKLLDPATGKQLGTHSTGPTWTWTDGSAIRGTVLKKSPSPDLTNIPWLLLQSTSTGGPGALASVTFVQRRETHGGNPPSAACDAAHTGTTTSVPYSATYSFFTSTP